jgi:hypothetical protein
MWIEMAMVYASTVMKTTCTMLFVNWMTPNSQIDTMNLMFELLWREIVVEAAVVPAAVLEIAVVPIPDPDLDLARVPFLEIADPDLDRVPAPIPPLVIDPSLDLDLDPGHPQSRLMLRGNLTCTESVFVG